MIMGNMLAIGSWVKISDIIDTYDPVGSVLDYFTNKKS